MRVAVLGGGLQGACVALELACAGVTVDIYDKNSQLITQASAQNEGKIHLGYVYANDGSCHTARTMIRGAVAFLPRLRRWLGSACEKIPISSPFHYVVHRDSLLSIAQVERHFQSVHALLKEELRGETPDYFGSLCGSPQRMSSAEVQSIYNPGFAQAVYRTAEIGIDPEALAALVRARVAAEPNLRTLAATEITAVNRADDNVTVRFVQAGQAAQARYDHVVNTLWDGRLAIDQTAGIAPPRPWLYRVKHYLRVTSNTPTGHLPSATIILGAFGDIVNYGRAAYLSWYPAGMRGLSSALRPPAWPLVLDEVSARAVRQGIFSALAQLVPAVTAFNDDAAAACEVKAGIIFAWGQTDIDDPASGLHERHAIGPQSYGRYHTVDTGKLTMAPLYGKMVADRILQRAN